MREPEKVRLLTYLLSGSLVPANFAVALFHGDWPLTTDRVCAIGLFSVDALAVGLLLLVVHQRWIDPRPAGQPRRIVAIGAHPDDLELACGGTIAKLHDSGHEVHALVMSGGEVGGDASRRPGEAVSGGKLLGTTSVTVHDFPDTRLRDVELEMTQVIEAAIRRYNADIVLTHSGNDQHQDHHAVHLATLRAGRQHPAILCYESPSVTSDFSPQVFVDIGDYVDVKVSAVSAHRDQAGKPYMTGDRIRGIASFRGSQAKIAHAEGFEPVRLLCSSVGDL
ncbi:PIG-L deacetylase family protein [Cryptosporangium sp. NPDC051539]|uniref:PIG-L deacetylase family protein n=1 Tax=Cryptosporangium sp. NPDC051539 TaxID=3363962 RepID=UPI00378ACBAE